MTEAIEQTIFTHIGDGVETTFAFNFTVPSADDERILVKRRDTASKESITLILGTDYSVDQNPGGLGGNIILTFALQVGFQLEIYRDELTDQEISDNDIYTIRQREDGDDKQARTIQENRQRIDFLEAVLTGDESGVPPPQTPIITPPTQSNTYLESNIQGDPFWQEKQIVVLRPQLSEAERVLKANSDGSTSWVQDLLYTSGEFVKQTTHWKYTDGISIRDLGIDFTEGDYEGIDFAIDNNDLPNNPVLGIDVAAGRVRLGAVENTGGIVLEDPLVDRFTIIKDADTISGSQSLSEIIFEGIVSTYTQKIVTQTSIVFYKSPVSIVTTGATAGKIYNVDWDLAEDATTNSTLQLIADGPGQYRVVDAEPPGSELLHINPSGGTPNNVPTALGWQAIEPEKFVDDSALTNGADRFADLIFEDAREKREASSIVDVDIIGGVLTIDLEDANRFFTIFDQDITNLTINNAVNGSSFTLVLETFDSLSHNIAWTSEFLFENKIAWQSSAFSGEVDALLFSRIQNNWYVSILADAVLYSPSQVIGVDTDQGGNVTTQSGDGTTVRATGESRIENEELRNFVLEDVRELQEADTGAVASVVAGVINLDIDIARVFEVSVAENVTAINITNNFDRGEGQQFFILFDETDDDLTYSFGADFLYENGQEPADSVNGQFKGYMFSWIPAIQRWLALRYS